jgi:integrase
LNIRRVDAKTDASARWIELNAEAAEAAARLLLRYQSICRKHKIEPHAQHYLLPFCRSRVTYGAEKGLRGYDPTRHQQYWDTAWHNLTEAVECPKCRELQAPAKSCRAAACAADMEGAKSLFSGFRFHDLRHSFITALVERGIPLGVIQAMVGHISARMLRHYTHVSAGAARAAVESLEPILPQTGVTVFGAHEQVM